MGDYGYCRARPVLMGRPKVCCAYYGATSDKVDKGTWQWDQWISAYVSCRPLVHHILFQITEQWARDGKVVCDAVLKIDDTQVTKAGTTTILVKTTLPLSKSEQARVMMVLSATRTRRELGIPPKFHENALVKFSWAVLAAKTPGECFGQDIISIKDFFGELKRSAESESGRTFSQINTILIPALRTQQWLTRTFSTSTR